MLLSLYPAALVIALVPLLDPLGRAWPFHLGDAGWRFLLVSVLVDHGAVLLAGLVIAIIAALLLDDRRTLRRLGITAQVLGMLLVVLVVLLLIHGLLIRRDLDPARQVVDFGVTRRVGAGILIGLAFLGLGVGTRRALSGWPESGIGSRRTSDRITGF